MKTLLLTRHAQALPAESGGDFERKLSPKGLADAHALGGHLKALNLIPDFVFCSSATRTRLTCEAVQGGMDIQIQTAFQKNIYNAGRGELFRILQDADDKHGTVMLVAHNPSIYELVVTLAASGSESALNQLSQGYAPATCSVIETDIEKWADLDLNGCRLKALFDPLDYNAPASPVRWT